ncbi:MAG TPA: DNA polymerase/3'-5' exonuclease PolX [Pirellulales bacterium]|jgi:DNA polymerase (family 10)|nr:DNA polymerase/3'-5' exonuclease PolX [Pirellulales bacterium]
MNNVRIADALDLMADLLEFQDANPFRVRAYRNGARTIRDYPEQMTALLENPERNLTEVAGVGKDLADKITVLVTTGSLPMLEELQAQVPQSVLALLRIPGMGPKKASVLFRELNIATLDQLRAACEAQQLRALKGFGVKTEEAILAGIALAASSGERLLWADADQYAQSIRDWILRSPHVAQLEIAGSYRRGKETIGDLDFLVVSDNAEAVMDHFAALSDSAGVIGRGPTKISLRLQGGLQVDMRVVPACSLGAALAYFTGSKDHNIVLRGLAKERGLKINEYGVYRLSEAGEEFIAGHTEADVYATLELPWIAPELREARREFTWAAAGTLPQLIEVDDLRADLHMHTTATDGKASLEAMVAAAQARGLEYIAITDHSKRVAMANGLDATRLREQWRAIDALNDRLDGFRILKGVEVDILEKGGLDLDDKVLSEADWVVASVHYGQNQPREQITRRVLEALAHPAVCAIAHPTGRLINRRKPYEIDLDAVFRQAREHGKLLELNANPNRLDLDDVACATAKSYGIPIVISSDAHSTEGLGVVRYGVLQARRAGLTAADVANTRSLTDFQALLEARRKR